MALECILDLGRRGGRAGPGQLDDAVEHTHLREHHSLTEAELSVQPDGSRVPKVGSPDHHGCRPLPFRAMRGLSVEVEYTAACGTLSVFSLAVAHFPAARALRSSPPGPSSSFDLQTSKP